MAKIEIDFEWPVAAKYQIEPARKRGKAGLRSEGNSGFLVARGKAELRRPLETRSNLYLLLLPKRPFRDTVVLIAAAYGMLTMRSIDGDREPLSVWADLIKDLRKLHLMENKMRGSAAPFSKINALEGIPAGLNVSAFHLGGQLDIALKPRKANGQPTLALKPWNLRDAIKLQCAQTISTNQTIRECENCGDFFETGGEGGKRADSRFCSQPCRYKFNNRRKLVERNKSRN